MRAPTAPATWAGAWADDLGEDELARLEAQLRRFVGDAVVRPDAPGWVVRDDASS